MLTTVAARRSSHYVHYTRFVKWLITRTTIGGTRRTWHVHRARANETRGERGTKAYTAIVDVTEISYLGAQLFDLVGELLALARVLPFCRLFAFHDLQQVQVLLFELLFLREQLVETAKRLMASD